MRTRPTVEVEVAGTPAEVRPPYRGVVVLGLVVAGTAPLWILVPEGLAGAPFIAPFVAVPLLCAGAVRWFGSWARTVGLLAGLALLAVAAPFGAEVLGHPDSFFDFFPVASMLVGAVLAVGGSLASALPWRRARDGRARGGRLRGVAAATVAVLVTLASVSAVLTFTGRHTVSAIDRFGAEPVALVDFAFEPVDLTVPAGRPARFVVRNDDLALHTFTIDELGVDAVVKPGRESLVEFTPERAGTHLLYCRPHTQDGQGMVATLTVE